MSEALLERQMERQAQLAEDAMTRAAVALAKLDQAMDLLTALGVPRTTRPESEDRNPGMMDIMSRSTPRTLSLTERIMHLANVPVMGAAGFTSQYHRDPVKPGPRSEPEPDAITDHPARRPDASGEGGPDSVRPRPVVTVESGMASGSGGGGGSGPAPDEVQSGPVVDA